MIITLPWPDKRLSPNARPHWAQKAKAVKAARVSASCQVMAWMPSYPPYPVGIQIAYTFHPADKRRRDLDNLIASTKAYSDGIAEALRVDDSTFKLAYQIGEVRKPACVVVVIS